LFCRRDATRAAQCRLGLHGHERDFLRYCRSEAEIEVMRQLKSLFDPKGILNEGKVL